MKRLVCMILFVGGGWLLHSKPTVRVESQKTKELKKEGSGNGRIIEFYVPATSQRKEPLIACPQKGKVIVFCAEAKKPA